MAPLSCAKVFQFLKVFLLTDQPTVPISFTVGPFCPKVDFNLTIINIFHAHWYCQPSSLIDYYFPYVKTKDIVKSKV